MINFNQDLVPTLDPNQIASVGEGIGRLLQTRQLQKEQAQQKVDMREAGIMSQFLRLNSPEEAVAYANMVIKQHPDLAPDINELLPDIQNNWGGVKSAIAGKLRGSPVGAGMIPNEGGNRVMGSSRIGSGYKPTGKTNEAGEPLYQLVSRREVIDANGEVQIIETPYGELTNDPVGALGQEQFSRGFGSRSGAIEADLQSSEETTRMEVQRQRQIEEEKKRIAIERLKQEQAIKLDTEGQIRESIARGQTAGKAQGDTLAQYQTIVNSLPELDASMADLRELSQKASYTMTGQAWNAIVRELGFPVSEAANAKAGYTALVDNFILPQLKATFGSAFTASEGDRLKATLGREDLSPPEKQIVLDQFVIQKRRQVLSLYRELKSQGVNVQAPEGVQVAPQGAPAQPGAAPSQQSTPGQQESYDERRLRLLGR